MAMAALLSASMSIPAYAFTPSTNTEFSGGGYTKGVDVEQKKEYTEYGEYTNTDTTHETSKETEVYATIGSTFSYVLPKIVTLDGQDRGGKYRVRVKGDIAGSQKISIVPDASFTMSEVNASVDKKADITASVEQGKTEWNQTEINKDDYNDEIGTITANDISAGSWSGTFNFNTKLENTVPKKKTYVLKKGSDFKNLIPSSATSVVFTDEVMPSDATVIDVDEDGDGGVVGWLDGTVFKVSTQKSGQKVMANANASAMFSECSNLTTLDLSGFDTSNVVDMSQMFYGCSGLTTLDVTGWDTSKVTNMSGMFFHCSGLTTLNVTDFDTSNVTNMASMFNGCSGLTTLNVTDFGTSKVTNMASMFNGCSGLTTLNVTGFDTLKVTNMCAMFYDCSNLTTLDLSGFDTSNVTDMRSMFYNCSKLTTLNLSGFDTSSVTNMASMFNGCSGLTTLNVTGFDTSNVTSMDSMFRDCSNLTTLDLSGFDTSKVTNMDCMFSDCSSLTTIYIGDKWKTASSHDDMFYGCGTSTLTHK